MRDPDHHRDDNDDAMRAADGGERALLARIAAADAAAFETLYRGYYGRLFRFVARTLRRTDVADEIINDVMYVVWEKAATYNGSSRPSTWIFGIAYNKARRFFSDPGIVRSLETLPAALEPADLQWEEARELEDLVEKLLAHLSAEQRLVLELTYYQGMHYREIAAVMDCPENTVKTRMFHARRKLGLLLEQDDARAPGAPS
ncbi:MAG: sigma-70 family RNA polymerase sigma factor [Gammaproteobacteria bacterium]